MDLIEKFCCWMYIFVQLNAGCLRVPTVCFCTKMWVLIAIHTTVLPSVYCGASCEFKMKSIAVFCVGAWNQLKDEKLIRFLESTSDFLKLVDIPGAMVSVLFFFLYVVNSSLAKQGWKAFCSGVTWDDGFLEKSLKVQTCCNSFARRSSCCVNGIAKFLMSLIHLISGNTCCVSTSF